MRSFEMRTYNKYLAAAQLAHDLLLMYAEEAQPTGASDYAKEKVEKKFAELVELMNKPA